MVVAGEDSVQLNEAFRRVVEDAQDRVTFGWAERDHRRLHGDASIDRCGRGVVNFPSDTQQQVNQDDAVVLADLDAVEPHCARRYPKGAEMKDRLLDAPRLPSSSASGVVGA